MHLGYNNPKADYVMDGSVVYCSVLVRQKTVLGVIVSDDFKWEKHCSEAVKKANKISGMIKKFYRQITVDINSLVQKSSQTTLGILLFSMVTVAVLGPGQGGQAPLVVVQPPSFPRY